MVDCSRCLPDYEDLEDEALVELTREGRPEAFNCLFERHNASYRRLALSLVKNDADASDVVQTAFLNIYSKIDTFNGDGSFAGWSYRIVRNTALMLLRSRKRRREVDLDAAPQSAYGSRGYAAWCAGPADALSNKEIREVVDQLLDRLEPKYRRAIELRELQGKSMEEIGQELDLSVGGAKTRLHRARAYLRVWLEDEHGLVPAA